jgi:hypothetical protein
MVVENHIFSVVMFESRVPLGVWFLAYVSRVDVLFGPLLLLRSSAAEVCLSPQVEGCLASHCCY